MKHSFYSGTIGLVIPVTKAHFPAEFQQKSSLHYYASILNSVEINRTFYKLPKSETIAKWSASVPRDFQFTFKLSKAITHSPQFDFSIADVEEFLKVIDHIGEKKGCILAQFPPSVKVDKMDQIRKLLEVIRTSIPAGTWNLALEFRDSSWYSKAVNSLLHEFNTSLVLHDMNGSATRWQEQTNDFIYLRFHGPEPRYRGDYSKEFLKQRAEQIKNWLYQKKTVYAYFNNTMGGAFRNLQTLNEFVG